MALFKHAAPNVKEHVLWTIWSRVRYMHGSWRWYRLLPSSRKDIPGSVIKKMHDWLFLSAAMFLSKSYDVIKDHGLDMLPLVLVKLIAIFFFLSHTRRHM